MQPPCATLALHYGDRQKAVLFFLSRLFDDILRSSIKVDRLGPIEEDYPVGV